jgi:hypothetical protein
MQPLPFSLRYLSLLLLLTAGPVLRGQQYTPREAGIGIVSQTASVWNEPDNYVGPRHIFAGPQGRYTWNLSPSLAVEGSVAYLPGFQTNIYGGDNGTNCSRWAV